VSDSGHALLDISTITGAAVCRDPFEYFVARDVIPADAAQTVIDACPALTRGGSYPVAILKCGPAFESLLTELRSQRFADAIGACFAMPDLATLPQLITFRGWSSDDDGSVHTDAEWKLITVLLYLNASWNQPGGRLRLLRSTSLDDVAVEVPPMCGMMVAFRRSSRSYHGHLPSAGLRRVLQVNWVTDPSYVVREERRHRRSALFKSMFGLRPL
jgi:hypothetical protein